MMVDGSRVDVFVETVWCQDVYLKHLPDALIDGSYDDVPVPRERWLVSMFDQCEMVRRVAENHGMKLEALHVKQVVLTRSEFIFTLDFIGPLEPGAAYGYPWFVYWEKP